MGKQNNDPTVVNSSIALLQERFKQLERVKLMREERELLRGFVTATEAERPSPVSCGGQPNWFLHTDLVRPSRPLFDTCNRYDRPQFQAVEASLSMGFRQNWNSVGETADVDTSLHPVLLDSSNLSCNIATIIAIVILQFIWGCDTIIVVVN